MKENKNKKETEKKRLADALKANLERRKQKKKK
jgi:hypothetical protein